MYILAQRSEAVCPLTFGLCLPPPNSSYLFEKEKLPTSPLFLPPKNRPCIPVQFGRLSPLCAMYILSRLLTAVTYKPLLDGILAVLMSTPSRPRSTAPHDSEPLTKPQDSDDKAGPPESRPKETVDGVGPREEGGAGGGEREGQPSSGGEATTASGGDDEGTVKPLRGARSSRCGLKKMLLLVSFNVRFCLKSPILLVL